MKKHHNPKIDQLMRAFNSLQSMEECSDFFEDLCTRKELLAFSQRLDVAKMLMKGYTYEQIEEYSGATFNTITRVQKVLQKDHFLKTIINRIES